VCGPTIKRQEIRGRCSICGKEEASEQLKETGLLVGRECLGIVQKERGKPPAPVGLDFEDKRDIHEIRDSIKSRSHVNERYTKPVQRKYFVDNNPDRFERTENNPGKPPSTGTERSWDVPLDRRGR